MASSEPVVKILHRSTAAVLWEGPAGSVRAAVYAALAAGADLTGADLRGTDLRGTDLTGANLRGANLTGANLTGANLRGTDLRGTDLRGTDLRGTDLTPIRDDVWAILSSAPREVPALIASLREGRVNYTAIPGLRPSACRPAECFFLGIQPGDTPETSQFSRLAVEWATDWLTRMREAFGGHDPLMPTRGVE